MSKVIDYVALRLAALGLLFCWSVFLFDKLTEAVLFTLTGFVVFVIVMEITKKTSSKTKYRREKLEFQMSVLGSDYVLDLYKTQFPAAEKLADKYFVDDGTLYYSAYKFFPCSVEDVCQAFRAAKSKSVSKVKILCKSADKTAQKLTTSLGIKIEFVKSKDIYKKLQKADLLPDLIFEKTPDKLSFSDILDLIFSKQNIRYYLVSGLMLTLVSLVSPIKTYYIVVGTLSLILAAICAVKK